MKKMKLIVDVTIDNKMELKFEEEFRSAFESLIGDSKGGYGEIQELILDNMEFDDDIGFDDIGVKIDSIIFTSKEGGNGRV